MDARQLCTFFLDGLLFGVDVTKVHEVIRLDAVTRVPLAPAVLSGLINLRGQIVTALDLRRRLDLPERSSVERPISVVVEAAGGPLSLLVDEIGDVVEVDAAAFERPPETLRGSGRELIVGAYKLADRLLLVLDTDKATAPASATATVAEASSRRESACARS